MTRARAVGRASEPTGRLSQVQVMDLETLMGRLGGAPGRADSLTHLEIVAARRAAEDATWPDWLGDPVREAFAGHRRTQSVDAPARRPPTSPTAASTPSSPRARRRASRCATCCPGCRPSSPRRGPKGQRGASVLYLAPTKALAQDQLAALRRLGLPDLRCAHPRRRLHAGAARVDPRPRGVRPHQPRHAAPLPAAGSCALVAVLRLAALRRGRRVPPLPRGLRRPRRADPAAAAAGRRARTAPTPPSCWPRPPSPSPQVSAGRLTGLDVVAVTDDGSPRGRTALALWEPPFVPGRGRERRAGPPLRHQRGRRPAHRPRRRAGPHARVRPVPARRRDRRRDRPAPARRGRRRAWSTRSRPTAAATCPRSAASSRRRCAPVDCSAWPRPTRSSSASTSAGSTPCCSPASPAPAPRCGSRSAAPGRGARDALGGAGGARRPAGHLPGQPPGGPARPAGRGQRLRPRQPLRARTAPVRGRGGVTADGGRPPALRARCPHRRRRADRGRAAAPAAARLVLDRPTPSQRPGRHPLLGRYAGPAGRGRDRSRARHRGPLLGPRHRPHRARSTSTRARPGWSPSSTSRSRWPSWCPPTPATRPRPARSPTSRSSPNARRSRGGRRG